MTDYKQNQAVEATVYRRLTADVLILGIAILSCCI
jgi:hypothetical protein